MKASVEWLKEYSDINVAAKELGDMLTMTGTKLETVESRGNDIKNVVIGKVIKKEDHPDSDHLVVCQVDLGIETVQIVTGAPNVFEGMIVPVAKDGSELPGGVKIKKGKLRGIDSCGMMCSVGELNIPLEMFPGQIEEGLMSLPKEYEKDLGKDVVEVLDLQEDILDFEITPNRQDCLSIEGIGRETAATLGEEFKNPRKNLDENKQENKNEIEGLTVEISAPDLCYRYIARIVKNVKIGPSPKWMVKRLNACGVRSINNIVDITNYVMLELGQPMHAFDINSIEGKHINVRRATNGEKIITLDNQERELDENNLVIADSKKAVAIAGVMGGQNSEIEGDTETVVFESAVFNGGNVRKTSKKVGLRTEASSRYEKGLSPENAERAIDRAVELVEMLNVGVAVEGKIDVYPTKQEVKKVEIRPDKINKLLGTNIEKDEMIKIFKKLDLRVEGDTVIAPYFRQDIENDADLAEEVVRFYGYDKLETTLISSDTTLGVLTKAQKLEEKIKNMLVSNGLSEISTYGFIGLAELDKCNIAENSTKREGIIKLKNPLSEEYTIMRTTTIPTMMTTLSTNYNKKNKNVKLFDISKTYQNIDNKIEAGDVPNEDHILTIGMYGENDDFYSLKGLLENVLETVSINRYDIYKETENTSYHPGRCANIKIGNDIIATLGEIHPTVLENYGIKQRGYLAEVNLTKLTKYSRVDKKKYTEVSKFPAVERDIAVTVDETVEVGQIEKIIQKKAKKYLESAKLFDIYRDSKLGDNKKSIAYSLIFRDKNKTLQDEEVNTIMDSIVSELEKSLKATLRT
ncbi:MAG: phenylalanine--tRNA ligase subunit beta [Clostridia bacterium]|nr:phenylalanine--tRNA ligase subunit beta [Clostridia bacterium]